ncbi:HAD domain-containing protein [Streptomyces roseofulvus]|uniref:HAD domain-containing protein n=2 Tax=Streptomyces TaxID=1883 RepID=A0ABU4KG20_9ACTN|nr:HAD domain-containing protein [Streptomyces roseolus]MDX2296464.1 HAD domain-containing protein [Streptomyces roseolus]
MTGTERLPLLFLDVDGPLIPFGADPRTYPTFTAGHDAPHPLLSRIDPAHGARLAALPCEVVWATTWGDDANTCVAPLLGLPRLAVVPWPEPSDADDEDVRRGLHGKTRPLVAWAAGRPFVWIDDEITDRDRAWVAAHHPGHALLLRVDARVGLTDADYAACDAWLRRERDRPA